MASPLVRSDLLVVVAEVAAAENLHRVRMHSVAAFNSTQIRALASNPASCTTVEQSSSASGGWHGLPRSHAGHACYLDNPFAREDGSYRRALTQCALDRQRCAMQCQQLTTDREPETAATEFPTDRGVCLLKRLAKRSQARRIDADPGVGRHDQGNAVLRLFDG